MRRLLAALALVVASTSALSCDYLLLGTYTGLCDEPPTVYPDMGDSSTARMAQCQVQGNYCCRHPEVFSGKSTDLRTYCLKPQECYLADRNQACYGDVDCKPSLACVGNQTMPGQARQMGHCDCPGDGVFCTDSSGEGVPFYCCASGMVCGQGSCMPPTPPDMTVIDLQVPHDMARRGVDSAQ